LDGNCTVQRSDRFSRTRLTSASICSCHTQEPALKSDLSDLDDQLRDIADAACDGATNLLRTW